MRLGRFLSRIDEHIAQANEHMARGNELMTRIDERMARGDEFMARIDERMARGDEFMARIDERMARGDELMARIGERMAGGDEVIARIDTSLAAIHEELRLSREQRARSDARYEALAGRYEDQAQLTREVVRRNEIAFEDSRRALAELVEEVRAQTRAIFRVLDRLDGGAQPETT